MTGKREPNAHRIKSTRANNMCNAIAFSRTGHRQNRFSLFFLFALDTERLTSLSRLTWIAFRWHLGIAALLEMILFQTSAEGSESGVVINTPGTRSGSRTSFQNKPWKSLPGSTLLEAVWTVVFVCSSCRDQLLSQFTAVFQGRELFFDWYTWNRTPGYKSPSESEVLLECISPFDLRCGKWYRQKGCDPFLILGNVSQKKSGTCSRFFRCSTIHLQPGTEWRRKFFHRGVYKSRASMKQWPGIASKQHAMLDLKEWWAEAKIDKFDFCVFLGHLEAGSCQLSTQTPNSKQRSSALKHRFTFCCIFLLVWDWNKVGKKLSDRAGSASSAWVGADLCWSRGSCTQPLNRAVRWRGMMCCD